MSKRRKNVISVTNAPVSARTIDDMIPGESGYTAPWAYKDGILDENFDIGPKGGTASLYVKCVSPGKYAITY